MNLPAAADAVVHARYVMPMSPVGTVLENHAVVIQGGRVAAVVPSAQARLAHPLAEVVERPRHVLLPGFVNAHTHAAMTLLRGATGGQALDDWLDTRGRAGTAR